MKRKMYAVVHKDHKDTFLRTILCATKRQAITSFILDNQHSKCTWEDFKKEGWNVMNFFVSTSKE